LLPRHLSHCHVVHQVRELAGERQRCRRAVGDQRGTAVAPHLGRGGPSQDQTRQQDPAIQAAQRLRQVQTNAQVAGFLFNSARSGNVTAQIFWLKTRARWRETPLELRHSGSVGRRDMSELTDEQLMAIIHSAGPLPEVNSRRLIDAKARFLNLVAEPTVEDAAEPT